MITDGEKWHYLAVTRLSGLCREITSKHDGDFYCLNYFRPYTTRNKLERHKNVCENHDYCCTEIPNEDNKILKYNHKYNYNTITINKKEEKKHNKQKVCHICRKGFNTDDSDKQYHKVKDHCHYTGKYRGAAHDICNLRYKKNKRNSSSIS